jgi:SAM-dependent methyltransferase
VSGIEDLETLLVRHNRKERESGEDTFSSWMGVNCEIHPDDEIFRFFYNHPECTNPLRDYFADGWRSLLELMVVLEKIDCPLIGCDSFLEFASGYGRLTRHLSKFPGSDKVHAADLMPESVEFIKEKFAIDGFYSNKDPDKLEFPQQYEVVFVLSLFSHLPKRSWGKWLGVLFSAVKPGGYLIFSTHGEGFARRNKVELDQQGFFFIASSESSHLAGEEYGTSITSAEFVKNTVAGFDDMEVALFQADHFWAGQDAWAIKKPA